MNLNGQRALAHQAHDLIEHPGRIGAVADEIAQQRVVRGALRLCIGQHGLKGLPVGVDVGDEGPAHGRQLATKL